MRKPLVLTLALAISGSAFADTCMVSPTSKEQVSGRFGKFREGGAANFGSGNAKPHMHDGLDFSTSGQNAPLYATSAGTVTWAKLRGSAGNTVIIKPSPNTPIIAAKFMECVAEAGLPAGVLNLLTGQDAVLGDALVDSPRTRFINFTGSVRTGLRIHERAAKVQPGQNFIKRVYAEMGGKDALIVDETADLEAAAEAAVASAFGFQGQKCSALSRLIVVDEVYDDLLERIVERTKELEVGPAEVNSSVTPVINETQFDRILEYIETGKGEGRLVCGGEKAEGDGWFIKPTIFADVPRGAVIAREEIFGPVLAVVRAADFDEALDIVNDSDYALTGGVFSQDRYRLTRARQEFEAGNLYINRKITGALVGVQAFGGYKLSGDNAKAGGPDYLRLFMLATTVTERF